MLKIKIVRGETFPNIFYFYSSRNPQTTSEELMDHYHKFGRGECEKCSACLSPNYVYIIETLREKNLLPDKYKMLCCACWKGGMNGV